ncbi:MAG: hypothetical protein P8Y29_02685 [Gemmatimonadota bacterium]
MSDDRLDTFREWLDGGEPSRFGPFFASRVMRRIESEESRNGFESIDAALRWGFLRGKPGRAYIDTGVCAGTTFAIA